MLCPIIFAAIAAFTSQVSSAPGKARPFPPTTDAEPGRWTLEDLKYNSWGNDKYSPDQTVKQKIALKLTHDNLDATCTGQWDLADTPVPALNCTNTSIDTTVKVHVTHVTVPEGRERGIHPLCLSITEQLRGENIETTLPSQTLYEFDDIERDNKIREDTARAAEAELRQYKKDKKYADEEDIHAFRMLDEVIKENRRNLEPGRHTANNTGLLCRPEVVTTPHLGSFWTSYTEVPKSLECIYTAYDRNFPLKF